MSNRASAPEIRRLFSRCEISRLPIFLIHHLTPRVWSPITDSASRLTHNTFPSFLNFGDEGLHVQMGYSFLKVPVWFAHVRPRFLSPCLDSQGSITPSASRLSYNTILSSPETVWKWLYVQMFILPKFIMRTPHALFSPLSVYSHCVHIKIHRTHLLPYHSFWNPRPFSSKNGLKERMIRSFFPSRIPKNKDTIVVIGCLSSSSPYPITHCSLL